MTDVEDKEIDNEAIDLSGSTPEGAVDTGAPEDPIETPEATPADGSDDSDVKTLSYGDYPVEVDIDDDVRSALTEKGIDAEAIVKELYTSKDFSLTRETKDKLDAAFGTYFVDYYLRTAKESNDRMVKDHEAGIKEKEDSVREAEEWGVSTVGGDWDAFEAKALPLMSDAQIEQFNAAMASGNQMVQEYALKAAMGIAGIGVAATHAEPEVPEIELGGEGAVDTSGAITAAEYRTQLIQIRNETKGDRSAYLASVAKLDSRRAAGIARGI